MFWWAMFVCALLIPIAMVVAGRLMWKHPPKEINRFAGYRTRRSMKNEDTWIFAHEYSGRLWWIMGLIMLIPSIVPLIPFYNGDLMAIGIMVGAIVTIQCVAIVISVILTESALKKTFFEDGTRR